MCDACVFDVILYSFCIHLLTLTAHDNTILQFFGCELGAQTTYNAETDRAIVNGHHTDKVLQDMIHKYIESFVLCSNCGLPET